jgi:hypothetical protein
MRPLRGTASIPKLPTRHTCLTTAHIVSYRNLIRTIPHDGLPVAHTGCSSLSRHLYPSPSSSPDLLAPGHRVSPQRLWPLAHCISRRHGIKSIGVNGHWDSGPRTPQVRRFGYRLVLRDTFSLVSFLILLTTWIPRSPNIVARCADGEPYGVFLLTLSFLSLYSSSNCWRFVTLTRGRRPVHEQVNQCKCTEMELPTLQTGIYNLSVELIPVLYEFRGSCDPSQGPINHD